MGTHQRPTPLRRPEEDEPFNVVRLLVHRGVAIVAILLGVTVVTFFLAQVIPADPAVNQAGEFATKAMVQQIRRQEGLDKPVPVQYGLYLDRLLHGNLGTSLYSKQPVASELPSRIGATLDLATAAMILAVVIGIPAGVAAAVYRGTVIDHLSRLLALVGTAMPVFWLGLVLVRVFYLGLHLLPAVGEYSVTATPPPVVTHSVLVDSVLAGDWSMLGDAAKHLVLPALTLGIMGAGLVARVMRASMLDVFGCDYIVTARAKGLGTMRIVCIHALRNALLPAVTVVGLTYGALLGGAVLTETVFSWPGLGLYAVEAMGHLDFPAVMGAVMVMTLAYVIANLIVDLLYGVLDPRVRRAAHA